MSPLKKSTMAPLKLTKNSPQRNGNTGQRDMEKKSSMRKLSMDIKNKDKPGFYEWDFSCNCKSTFSKLFPFLIADYAPTKT